MIYVIADNSKGQPNKGFPPINQTTPGINREIFRVASQIAMDYTNTQIDSQADEAGHMVAKVVHKYAGIIATVYAKH